MVTSAYCPVNGMIGPSPSTVRVSHTGSPLPNNSFARLVELYRSNHVLLNELDSARNKLERARAYLASPTRNPALAAANLVHLKSKHSVVLTLLRANRRQVQGLLGRAGVARAEG